MSPSNRMYERLCKLYHLLLVRMRGLEAVQTLPQLRKRKAPAVNRFGYQKMEALEPRVLLSGTPTLPGMHLANDDIANWQGQVIFLDFDGAQNTTYDGPAAIIPFDVPAYVPPSSQQGQSAAIQAQVVDYLNTTFADTGVSFTLIQPTEGDYSTIYVGGNDDAFHSLGRFASIAEGVDQGNASKTDEAWVFSQGMATTLQLIDHIQHEAGHLLGYAHEDAASQNALAAVATNTYQLGNPQYLNQTDGLVRFYVTRTDISTTETVYLSTADDLNSANIGQYDNLDDLAVTFEAGQSHIQVTLRINDLELFEGSSTFRMYLKAVANDPQSAEIASSEFTILNYETSIFDTRYMSGILTHDTSIVDHIPQIVNDNHRFVGLYLGQGDDYLSASDAAIIQAAGLKVVSVFQQSGMSDTDQDGNHTYAWQSYFNQAQGASDAASAYLAATQNAQQPFGSAIYFSIDVNPADTDGITPEQALDAISNYFQGIEDYFNALPPESRYIIGIKGAGDTLTRIIDDGLDEYVWLANPLDWPGRPDWYNPDYNPGLLNMNENRPTSSPTKYGGIEYSTSTNRILPMGSWHEVVEPQISSSEVALTMPYRIEGNVATLQAFTLRARNMVPGDTITLTAPDGFEVGILQVNTTVYASSITLTPVDGYLSGQIRVRATSAVVDHPTGELVITSNQDPSLTKTIYLYSEIQQTIDTTAPVIENWTASSAIIPTGESVTFSYTMVDEGGAGLSSMFISRAPDVNGSPFGFASRTNVSFGFRDPKVHLYSGTYTETPEEGIWWYRISVRDGNSNSNDVTTTYIKVIVADMIPSVTGISPSSGRDLGGTEVVITGEFFTGATSVLFGDVEATSFTVDSDNQITAISPAHTQAGTVDVTVITDRGTSPSSTNNKFTYVEFLPNLTTHQPEGWSAPLVLSHQLEPTGDGGPLYAGQDIYLDLGIINNGQLAAGSFEVNYYRSGMYQMTLATISSLAPGETIELENINIGQLPLANQNIRITIDPTNQVRESDESDNIHQITVRTERAPDTTAPIIHDFTISDPFLSVGEAFTYSYTISDSGGSGLSRTWLYRWNDVNGAPGGNPTLTNRNDHTGDGPISASWDFPHHYTPGTWWYQLYVRDTDGNISISSDFGIPAFSVTVLDQPAITGLSVTEDSTLGGESIIINGSGFTHATAVHFGNSEVTSFTIDSDTQITAIVPPADNVGEVDVTVTTPVGTSSTSDSSTFNYYQPLPDLLPTLPDGWDDTLVLSHEAGTHTDAAAFYDDQDIHLDFAVTNAGEGSSGLVKVYLYINDVFEDTLFNVPPLAAGETYTATDLNIGKLAIGSHTIKLVINPQGNPVQETDETNNEYTRTIAVTRSPDTVAPVVEAFEIDQTVVTPGSDVTINYTVSDAGRSGLETIRIYKSNDEEAQGSEVYSYVLSTPIDGQFTGSFVDPDAQEGQWWYRIEVIDADGNVTQGSDVGFGPIAVDVYNQPDITGLSETEGSILGGQSLIITGTDFTHATAVHFGDIEATSFNIDSDTQITVVVPPALIEDDVDVTVTSPLGTSPANQSSKYIYTLPPAPYDTTFDFGESNSPVLAGAVRVTDDSSYNAGQGYGWQSGSIISRDRGPAGANDMTRDFNATLDGTFAVDLANGYYSVTVHLGETEPYIRDQMGVYLEGALVDSVTAEIGQIATRTYIISVTDGQLNLRLRDLGGSDPTAIITGLQIASSEQPVNYPPAVDDVAVVLHENTPIALTAVTMSAGFTDPNAGQALQVVRITSLPAHGQLTLNNQAVTAGQEITRAQLAQLIYTPQADYIGQDSFSWNGSDGSVFADDDAQVILTIETAPPYNALFDFGTTRSVVESGALRVSEKTSYNPSQGYGWQSGDIISRDRGPSGATALTRDFNATLEGTFAVDLANGDYTVTVHLGETDPYLRDEMGVHFEGTLFDSVTAPIGQVVARTYIVTVTDGQLNLHLKDLGGVDPTLIIAGLQISSV